MHTVHMYSTLLTRKVDLQTFFHVLKRVKKYANQHFESGFQFLV